jgi:hypothetical protein
MGNGASCTRVEQYDESVQMPSISPSKPPSTSSSLSPTYKILLNKQPPISSVQEEGFSVTKNADKYSSIWDYNAKVSLLHKVCPHKIYLSLLY